MLCWCSPTTLSCDLQAGFDVLNALTLLDNNMFLTDQKVSFPLREQSDADEIRNQFGPGDGFLVSHTAILSSIS